MLNRKRSPFAGGWGFLAFACATASTRKVKGALLTGAGLENASRCPLMLLP